MNTLLTINQRREKNQFAYRLYGSIFEQRAITNVRIATSLREKLRIINAITK